VYALAYQGFQYLHKSIMLEKIPAFHKSPPYIYRSRSTMPPSTSLLSFNRCSFYPVFMISALSLTLPYATEVTTLTPTALSSKEWLNILGTHQQHLRSLDLSFTPDCTVNSYAVLPTLRREWCSVKVPNLRNLTIRIGSSLCSACLSGPVDGWLKR